MTPDNEQRKLRLVKGARSGPSGGTQPVLRRAVTRRPLSPGTLVAAESPDGSGDGPQGSSGADRSPPAPVDRGGRAGVPGSSRPRRVGDLLLLAAVAVTLAVAGLSGHRWYTGHALTEAHQQAVAAARQATVNFVSISAASVDRDLQRVIEGAAGEFKEEFTRGMPQVRAAVTENKVESSGSILRAGLVTGDRRSAVVLVAVDATVRNTNVPDGRAAHYRIQVELVKDRSSGAWLVSRLQFVG